MGAVAIRLTLLVWSPNMWMVSLTVKSWTCTLESAAPVMRIRSPECGKNCGRQIWHANLRRAETAHIGIAELSWQVTEQFALGTREDPRYYLHHTHASAHAQESPTIVAQKMVSSSHILMCYNHSLWLYRENEISLGTGIRFNAIISQH